MALGLVGLLGGYIASLDYDKSLFFIFLTHWGFSLIVLFHVVDFFYVGAEMFQQTKSDYEEPDRINYLGKLSWLICNVASAAAPFITAFYW